MKRLKEFIRSVPDYSRTGRGGCSIEYLAHNCLNNIRTAFNNQNLLRFNIMINKRLSIFLKSCKSSDNGSHQQRCDLYPLNESPRYHPCGRPVLYGVLTASLSNFPVSLPALSASCGYGSAWWTVPTLQGFAPHRKALR